MPDYLGGGGGGGGGGGSLPKPAKSVPDGPDKEEGYGATVAAGAIPVSIYLADEDIHEQVEQAVVDLLALAGLRIESRDEPSSGSWFRRMRADAARVRQSRVLRDGAMAAAHAADIRLVLAQDAVVTATLLQNLGPVIASLQPTKDAVIRMGAVLIVKVDWVVTVCQLTAAQQLQLDHQPSLALSPSEIIAALHPEPAREASPAELE